jgi:sugar diacid utilization regulator
MSRSLVSPAEFLDSAEGAAQAPEPDHDTLPALFEIVRRLQADEFQVDLLLGFIVQKAAELLRTDIAWVALVDEETSTVSVGATHGTRTAGFSKMTLPLGIGLAGRSLEHQRTLVVSNYPGLEHETSNSVREVMHKEGVQSVVCAPMLADRLVGLVYVGNRSRTAFTEAHASLMSTLAAQACVALRNGALHDELQRSNAVLQQSFAIHRSLTDAGLREGGLDGVTRALSSLLGCRVAIEQSPGAAPPVRVHADEAGATELRDETEPSGRVEILAGEDSLGWIFAYGSAPLAELQQHALQHGATVVATEILRDRAASEAEWRLQGELLESLVDAEGPLPDSVLQRAAQLEIDPHRDRRLLAVQCDADGAEPGRLLRFVRSQAALALGGRVAGATLAFQRGEHVIVAVPHDADGAADEVVAALRAGEPRIGSSVCVGISRARADLRVSYREAIACLKLARPHGGHVVDARDTGPIGLLLAAERTDQASAMVRERLGAVCDEDRTSRIPLLETLRAFVAADGHQPTAAASCFIHVSTLKYRMGRIETLFDAPIGRPDVAFDLSVAFRVLDVLEAMDLDPLQRFEGRRQPTG